MNSILELNIQPYLSNSGYKNVFTLNYIPQQLKPYMKTIQTQQISPFYTPYPRCSCLNVFFINNHILEAYNDTNKLLNLLYRYNFKVQGNLYHDKQPFIVIK